jgi:hypothetical protein
VNGLPRASIGRVNFGDVEAKGREDTLDFIRAMRAALEDPNNQGPIAVPAPKRASQMQRLPPSLIAPSCQMKSPTIWLN